MKLLLLVCLVGLAACSPALTVKKTLREILEDFKSNVAESELSHGKGHCACSHWGCWCHGVDEDLEIHAVFSVVETRHDHSSSKTTMIDGTFFIGKETFSKEFPADKFEDFCETVNGKRFCFRIDIHGCSSGTLKGCLRVSRPEKLDMGCFQLPLLMSKASPDSITRMDDTTLEIEAPVNLETRLDMSRCACGPHGCACRGTDGGKKVVVVLSLDECKHDGTKHAIINGLFMVGTISFERQFHEDELDDFCHEAEGRNFCFDIKANRVCSGHINGCIKLTKPQKVSLGCFRLPMMTAAATSADDRETVDEYLQPFVSIDVHDGENQVNLGEY